MSKFFRFNLISTILVGFLLSSCGGSKKDDFDLSDIKLPKNFVSKEESKEKIKEQKKIKIVKNELKPLKNKKDIMDSIKFGKKDPFAINPSNSNSTISKINLKGFISIDNKSYAMINYMDNEGPLLVGSKGGLDTTLLPKDAIIKEINPLSGYIMINFNDEFFKLPLKTK